MRKIAEKVAIVAQICITLIFVLISILYITGVIGIAQGNNSVVIVLMCVLAGVYVALSAYILYMNFSERENIKDILLFCDNESATRTNIKVINNIVKGCTKEVEGVVVRKVRVRFRRKGRFCSHCFGESFRRKRCSRHQQTALPACRQFQKHIGIGV